MRKNSKLVYEFETSVSPAERNRLRRRLKSRGLNPMMRSRDLADAAILLDNRAQVRGYLERSTNEEMHFAKGSNGKYAGKLKANAIEAEALRSLGLSNTDPKRLNSLLSKIERNRKRCEKHKRSRRINNRRMLANQQYEMLMRSIEQEDAAAAKLEPAEKAFDPDDINEFARKAFLEAAS